MTIDKSIALLEDYLEWQKLHDMDGTGIDGATKNLEVAKKYQKIQHIVRYDWGKGYQHSETINRIKEVIEDGKID